MNMFGFFFEFRDTSVSVLDAETFEQEPELESLISYLQRGPMMFAVPYPLHDPLRDDNRCLGGLHIHTDGVWCWPHELAYLVEEYKVAIPVEFRERMKSLNWEPPEEDSLDWSALIEEYCTAVGSSLLEDGFE